MFQSNQRLASVLSFLILSYLVLSDVPEQPEAPRNLAITNIKASSVLLQFIPGFSGHTSISKWVVQAQQRPTGSAAPPVEDEEVDDDEWGFTVYEVHDPDANSITVEGLQPFTTYRYT